MTLFKQIMIAVITFGIMIFMAVGYLNFKSLNGYINDQLGENARHTANSLGLALKPIIDPDDMSLAQTMINSMFDSGRYKLIKLEDVDGKVLIENSQQTVVKDIPEWFYKIAKFEAPIADSEIMTGWTKFGTLYVQGSTALAYNELYTNSKSLTPNLFASAKIRIYDTKKGIDSIYEVNYLYELNENDNEPNWSEASEGMHVDANENEPSGASFAAVPNFILKAKNFDNIQKDFKEYLYRNFKFNIFEALGIYSKNNETKEQFYIRLQDKCNEILEEQTAKLTAKFEKERKSLQDKLNKALAKLDKEQKEMTTSGLDAAINIGASILGAIFGNKLLSRQNAGKIASSARSANRVLKERSDVKLSEQSVNDINLAISELEEKFEKESNALKEANDIKNITINEIQISPKKSDIYDEKVVLLWR